MAMTTNIYSEHTKCFVTEQSIIGWFARQQGASRVVTLLHSPMERRRLLYLISRAIIKIS